MSPKEENTFESDCFVIYVSVDGTRADLHQRTAEGSVAPGIILLDAAEIEDLHTLTDVVATEMRRRHR